MRLLYEFDVLAGNSTLHDDLVQKLYLRQSATYRGIFAAGREASVFTPNLSDDQLAMTFVALEDAYGLHVVAGNALMTVEAAGSGHARRGGRTRLPDVDPSLAKRLAGHVFLRRGLEGRPARITRCGSGQPRGAIRLSADLGVPASGARISRTFLRIASPAICYTCATFVACPLWLHASFETTRRGCFVGFKRGRR